MAKIFYLGVRFGLAGLFCFPKCCTSLLNWRIGPKLIYRTKLDEINKTILSSFFFILTFCILFFFFYILPLDQRIYDLGNDFAQYIQHACNIHNGQPYADLPYPFNPKAQIGPPAYPPVTSLLISLFAAGPGLQIALIRLESVIFPLLSLFVLYKIFSHLGGLSTRWEVLFVFVFLPGVLDTMGGHNCPNVIEIKSTGYK